MDDNLLSIEQQFGISSVHMNEPSVGYDFHFTNNKLRCQRIQSFIQNHTVNNVKLQIQVDLHIKNISVSINWCKKEIRS